MKRNKIYSLIIFVLVLFSPAFILLGIEAKNSLLGYFIDFLPTTIHNALNVSVYIFVPFLFTVLLGAILAVVQKKYLPPSHSFFRRNLPAFLPLFLLGIFAAIYKLLTYAVQDLLYLLIIPAGLAYLLAALAFTITGSLRLPPKERGQNKLRDSLYLLLLFLLTTGGAFATWYYQYSNTFINPTNFKELLPEEATHSLRRDGHGVDIRKYMPFNAYGKKDGGEGLARLGKPASLAISSNYPRLDGAIALLPLYGAAAKAVYKNVPENIVWNLIQCRNTPKAYAALIRGDVDIFFGAPPSPVQKEDASRQGYPLKISPIGRDAFVFFVNKDNPVFNLSSKQIRDIYTKKITNWKELGGSNEEILPFQRPEGSGSQTAMQGMVMQEKPLGRPLRREYAEGMGGVINSVAEYTNRLSAIGYSFRWYATVEYVNKGIRLLSIDGVLPTEENIRTGKYPFITDIIMATAHPLTPETQQLFDWMLGEEGQKLVEKVGYVPIK